jgi:hypothetical protein
VSAYVPVGEGAKRGIPKTGPAENAGRKLDIGCEYADPVDPEAAKLPAATREKYLLNERKRPSFLKSNDPKATIDRQSNPDATVSD